MDKTSIDLLINTFQHHYGDVGNNDNRYKIELIRNGVVEDWAQAHRILMTYKLLVVVRDTAKTLGINTNKALMMITDYTVVHIDLGLIAREGLNLMDIMSNESPDLDQKLDNQENILDQQDFTP